jgi:hypothetical protein
MIKANAAIIINCSAEEAFRYVANGFFENHPKWEPAVLELEKTSQGPIGVGTAGRQVRNDGGRQSDSTFRIAEFEPNRKFSVTSTGKPDFKATYTFEQIDGGTQLRFAFNLGLTGFAKLFEPVMTGTVKKGSKSIVDNLKRLLETEEEFV